MMFVAAAFKTQINCKVFAEGWRGGGAGQGTWSRGSGEAGETQQETSVFKISQLVGGNCR